MKASNARDTVWWCEECHASGRINLAGLSVYDAMYALEDAHNQHDLARLVDCKFSTSRVRVTEAPLETPSHG